MTSTDLDPAVDEGIRAAFDRQPFMALLGARLAGVGPGTCRIEAPVRPEMGQQNGYVHAGVTSSMADNACGFAAQAAAPAGASVLSIEFKLNLLAPAQGDLLVADARVVRAGRRVATCTADVHAVTGDERRLVAVMLATMALTLPAADGR